MTTDDKRARLREHVASCERSIVVLEKVREELRASRETAPLRDRDEIDANLRNNLRTIDTMKKGAELARAQLQRLPS